ncbi:secretion/DNA translocation related TadE-like protein [Microbacterium sp. AG1240]|uniref:Rv3654c family TadE-like protein n=1 Tax=Microbacterium sp. AG1240 TaxID=2183992 RepID=UPI000EB1F3B6|nr:Rv3654c family TadE-like protein [Microbacterium sp. AG1240]RKT33432.1 secretion/DNA translocation related TadE-like protein [Microbacterium sp. AG1240]
MAGAVTGVGVMAGVIVVTAALAVVGAASVHAQRLSGAADAAALAAADAASGAVAGVPCDRAAEVAATAGATVTTCDLDGLVATVTVSAPFAAVAASISARAGPPPTAAP